MTCEPVGWTEPGGQAWLWPGGGAAGALPAADEAIADAARGLAAADDVDWVSVAATRYRAVLAEGAAGLRAARRLLDDAAAAVAAHDAAVAQVEWARRSDAARWPPGAGVPAGFPLGTVGSGPFARPAPW